MSNFPPIIKNNSYNYIPPVTGIKNQLGCGTIIVQVKSNTTAEQVVFHIHRLDSQTSLVS